jgi:hypothetical protein
MKLDNYDKAMKGIEGLKQKALVMDSRVLRLHIKEVEGAINADGKQPGYTLLTKPLGKRAALKNVKEHDGRLIVVVPVGFNDLIKNDLDDNGVENLNLIMDEKVTTDGYIGDIGYKVVGSDPEKNEVHIEVNAELEWD